MQLHEVESIRRSFAMSPSLPVEQVQRLLETCERLLAERVKIERILKELGPSWRSARHALNDLSKVLHADPAER
jgi:hypothetical protein